MRMCCWKSTNVRSCLTKLYRSLFFNFFIRTAFETLLETSVICMIKLHVIDYGSGYETVNSTLALVSVGGLTLFCLVIPIFLTCKSDQFETPEFIAKYGALIQDLRHTNVSTRFFYMFFMARRLSLAALIVFLTKRSYAQIQILCLSCSFYLIYTGYFAPYQARFMNWLDLTNEYLVMTSTYFIFIYSDGFLLIPNDNVDYFVKDYKL